MHTNLGRSSCLKKTGVVSSLFLSVSLSGFFMTGCETTAVPPAPPNPVVSRWEFPNAKNPTFGYGVMRSADFARTYQEARHWPDQRPVLLGQIGFSDMPLHRPISEVEHIILGESFPSSQDYVKYVSFGGAALLPGITLGTFTAPMPRASNTSDIERGLIIQKALDDGNDLTARFDKNRDGVIDETELLVITIVADAPGTGGGGAVRPYCQTHRSSDGRRSARFCGRAASFSEYASFYVITHEILHTFGTIDLYNIGELGNNLAMTIMAGASGDNKIYLDPYHRIKLGWVGPRVFDVASAVRNNQNVCFTIAPSHTGDRYREQAKPVVIYDSRRGTQEYFIAEYRRRAGYDENIFSEGLGLWYIKEGSNQLASSVVLGYTRSASGRGLASVNSSGMAQGDDYVIAAWADGAPYIVTTGLDMVFDTPRVAPDVDLMSAGVLVYPPEHFGSGQVSGVFKERRLGFPKFWSSADLVHYPINWYNPYSRVPVPLGVDLRIEDFPSSPDDPIRLDFIANPSLPRPKFCQ